MSNPPVSPGFVSGQELTAAQLNQAFNAKQDYPAVTMPTNDNSLAVATTAFVQSKLSSTSVVYSFNARTGAVTLTAADVTGVGGALAASTVSSFNTRNGAVVLTGSDITGAGGALAASSVSSFNTRTGAVTLTGADITGAGGALSAASVSSFNTRTGAVSLTTADVTNAGGAPLASPVFTGTPQAPTPTFTPTPDNSQKLATTAYVQGAISNIVGVSSFNARTGAVTLNTVDVTNAGGAPLNSPIFTGTPQAPTAPIGNNSTQIATTAFAASATAARGHIDGLIISMAGGVSTFSVSPGVARDSNNVDTIVLPASISKTAGSWAAGNGNGAMDTGVVATNQWYYVYVIKRTDTQQVDILVSSSLTPSMPSSYTEYRRIGTMVTDTSGNWTLVHQNGDEFIWDVRLRDASAATVGTASRTLYSLSVPPGIQVWAMSTFFFGGAGTAYYLVTSPDLTDSAPSTTMFDAAISSTQNDRFYGPTRTNTSNQVGVRASASVAGNLTIMTRGWIDRRGKDA